MEEGYLVEKLSPIPATFENICRYFAEQFDEMRQVIVVATVRLSLLWIEQKFAG